MGRKEGSGEGKKTKKERRSTYVYELTVWEKVMVHTGGERLDYLVSGANTIDYSSVILKIKN